MSDCKRLSRYDVMIVTAKEGKEGRRKDREGV